MRSWGGGGGSVPQKADEKKESKVSLSKDVRVKREEGQPLSELSNGEQRKCFNLGWLTLQAAIK